MIFRLKQCYRRGDGFEFRCSRSINGVVVNLTGYTVRAHLKRVDSEAILHTFVPSVSLAHEVTLSALGSETATWPIDIDLRFDLEFTPPGGQPYTPVEYRFRLLPDVTL